MSDKTLAFTIYDHFNIPLAEWDSHYALDTYHGTLTIKARRAYRMIYRSIAASV